MLFQASRLCVGFATALVSTSEFFLQKGLRFDYRVNQPSSVCHTFESASNVPFRITGLFEIPFAGGLPIVNRPGSSRGEEFEELEEVQLPGTARDRKSVV